jgi:anti-sigma factor RsiW
MDPCDAIRDDLPLYAAGALDDERARQIAQHLRTCAECRHEQHLIALLRAPIGAPAGLQDRVRRAVGAAPAARARQPWRTALAAAVAVLVIGAGALVLDGRRGSPASLEPMNMDAAALGWAARMDPVLHGGVGLEALTDEELELLLVEMQS